MTVSAALEWLVGLALLSGLLGLAINRRLGHLNCDNWKDRFQYVLGRWIIGGFLVFSIAAIVNVVADIATCAKLTYAADKWSADLQDCGERASLGWFAVMTQWQAGIGAGIGLLGLAWAAYFDKKPEPKDNADIKLHFEGFEAEFRPVFQPTIPAIEKLQGEVQKLTEQLASLEKTTHAKLGQNDS